jgi:hypothetical protein
MADGKLVVYTVEGTRVGEASVKDGDVLFPDAPHLRWTWVLDARKEPYHEMPLDEVRHRAEHARKKYVLVSEGE